MLVLDDLVVVAVLRCCPLVRTETSLAICGVQIGSAESVADSDVDDGVAAAFRVEAVMSC